MIAGPSGRHETDEYFVTHQKLNARPLASEMGFSYELLSTTKKWKSSIKHFFDFDGKPKILELESKQEETINEFNTLKTLMKKSYG
jgi:2-succinyl-5-enolpyruvyl-6-hydroxy-3-cyclohexene-1-carboxylate synthase